MPIAAAAAILLAVAAALVPRTQAALGEEVTVADIRPIIEARCANCHSSQPTFAAFAAAPSGVLLDTDAQIRSEAARIHRQAVVLRAMPVGNLTGMTDDERRLIDAWYRGL